MIPLALVVGEGPRFGTGHAVRMRELRAVLNQAGRSLNINISRWQSVRGFETDDARAAARSLFAAENASSALHQPGSTDALSATGEASRARPKSLVILDARDLDPRPFVEQGARVLALDNRHACREEPEDASDNSNEAIDFYDTIPHPRANLRDTLERVLLAGDVRALPVNNAVVAAADASGETTRRDNPSRAHRRLFVYSGDFAVPLLDEALLRLFGDGWSVHRCGSSPPAIEFARRARLPRNHPGADSTTNAMRYSPRLERAEFLQELATADRVWTYFGMTLLEAWYLRRDCSMLPVDSPVHSDLADYLKQAAGLAVVSPASVATSGADAFAGGRSVADWRPGGRGFDLLIDRIHARVADLDPR